MSKFMRILTNFGPKFLKNESLTFFIKFTFSELDEIGDEETGTNWTWINSGSTGGLNLRILSWIEWWRWVICGGVSSIPRTWPESWIPNRTIPPCPWFKKPQIVWLIVFKRFLEISGSLKCLRDTSWPVSHGPITHVNYFRKQSL